MTIRGESGFPVDQTVSRPSIAVRGSAKLEGGEA